MVHKKCLALKKIVSEFLNKWIRMKVPKHTQGLQGPEQARNGLLPQKNQSVSGYDER